MSCQKSVLIDSFSVRSSQFHRTGYIATVAGSFFPSMILTVGSPHSVAKAACSLVFIASIDRDRFAWKGKRALEIERQTGKVFLCARLAERRGKLDITHSRRGAISLIHLPFGLYKAHDDYHIRANCQRPLPVHTWFRRHLLRSFISSVIAGALTCRRRLICVQKFVGTFLFRPLEDD